MRVCAEQTGCLPSFPLRSSGNLGKSPHLSLGLFTCNMGALVAMQSLVSGYFVSASLGRPHRHLAQDRG